MKMRKPSYPSTRKIIKVRKNPRTIGHLPLEQRKVTLREMKGYFRRGAVKLPLQIFVRKLSDE